MQRHRSLIAAAYVVGIALVVVPFADAAITVLPFRPDDVRWRFGVIGVLANALLIPDAGLLLLLTTAILAGHTRARTVLGVLAVIGVVGCVAAIGLFSLDAVQTRAVVRPGMGVPFAVASVSAVVKLLLATATLVVLSVVGLRAPASPVAPEKHAPLPLIPPR